MLRSLVNSWKMLKFADLKMYVHLNRMRMKKKSSRKSQKPVKLLRFAKKSHVMFGRVESFNYFCR